MLNKSQKSRIVFKVIDGWFVSWRIEINGPLALSENLDQGPLSLGSGQPPSTAADNLIIGQI